MRFIRDVIGLAKYSIRLQMRINVRSSVRQTNQHRMFVFVLWRRLVRDGNGTKSDEFKLQGKAGIEKERDEKTLFYDVVCVNEIEENDENKTS